MLLLFFFPFFPLLVVTEVVQSIQNLLISFQNEQQVVAIKALEYLSEHLQDCRQLFAALK